MRDLARLRRHGPSTSASVGRCPRTHQQLRTGSDGQTVLRAFGATQVTVPVVQEAAGVARGSQGVAKGVDTRRPRGKHVSAAREWRRTDTQVRTGASAVVSAHPSSKGGGAHSALQSRLGPDHHYVKLRKRCKKKLLFTPPIGSGELSYFLAYSCVFCRNGIAPYRELTFLVHRDNVKSVDETHRAYASQQQSYFLILFIHIHVYEHISRASRQRF